MNLTLTHPAGPIVEKPTPKLNIVHPVLREKENEPSPQPVRYAIESVVILTALLGALALARTNRPAPVVLHGISLPAYPDVARYTWSGYYRIPNSPFTSIG